MVSPWRTATVFDFAAVCDTVAIFLGWSSSFADRCRQPLPASMSRFIGEQHTPDICKQNSRNLVQWSQDHTSDSLTQTFLLKLLCVRLCTGRCKCVKKKKTMRSRLVTTIKAKCLCHNQLVWEQAFSRVHYYWMKSVFIITWWKRFFSILYPPLLYLILRRYSHMWLTNESASADVDSIKPPNAIFKSFSGMN